MWAVESNGVVSAVEERQRIGFFAPVPPTGQEPTLVASLSNALSNGASTGGGARFILFEHGSEFSVKRAIDEATEVEEKERNETKASGFGSLIGATAESEAVQTWLNPYLPLSKRVFFALRLSENCHRFPEATSAEVDGALKILGLNSLDLVLLPWPNDGHELCRKVRNRQTSLFLKAWNGPLAALRASGKVKAVGCDSLDIWQLERLMDDAHNPPFFNLLKLSPKHSKFDQVRYCQSQGIEVIAILADPTTANTGNNEGSNVEASSSSNTRGSNRRTGSRNHGRGKHTKQKKSVKDIAVELGRTELQIELTWALQRGLIAVPSFAFPSRQLVSSPEGFQSWLETTKANSAQCYSLVHPFTRRPLFCSPTLVHRVLLSSAHMTAIAKLDVDYSASEAEIAKNGELSDIYYRDVVLPTVASHAAINRVAEPTISSHANTPGEHSTLRSESAFSPMSHDTGGAGSITIRAEGDTMKHESESHQQQHDSLSLGPGGHSLPIDPTDEEAFLKFAEDENIDPEVKLKSLLGAYFGAEANMSPPPPSDQPHLFSEN